MNRILMFVLIGLSVIGCGRSEDSSDVNQARIYTDYELFYNANEDVTHAVARFRFGNPFGTILELSPSSGAGVTFNGDQLSYSSLWGAHHREYAGNVASGTFRYTDTDGAVYVNDVPGGSPIAFPSGFDGSALNKTMAKALAWDGSALAADDQVGVFIGSWHWGDDALSWTDADGATEIVLSVIEMQNLALGTATVYLDRWNAVDVSEGTSEGGRIRYKYRAVNATVTVVD